MKSRQDGFAGELVDRSATEMEGLVSESSSRVICLMGYFRERVTGGGFSKQEGIGDMGGKIRAWLVVCFKG